MIILVYLLLSIILILLLTSKFKIHPAISLLIGSFFLGILLNMNFILILEYLYIGFSNTIKSIGLIIILSAIIGESLKQSNSIKKFGNLILYNFQNKTLLSLNLLGLFLGTVVFCDSGFLILNGISKSIASSANYSLTSLNLSLSGGLYASHTLVPPTPGPLAAINNLNGISMIGDIMLLSIIVSIPASLISFFYAKIIFGRLKIKKTFKKIDISSNYLLPISVIVVPLFLISLNTLTNFIDNENLKHIIPIIKTIGNPIIALLIGTILSFFLPDIKENKINIIFKGIKSSTPILILTCMGASFGNVIKNSELTSLLTNIFNNENISLIYIVCICFIISIILKTSQGSSTSSMIIGSSIIFPLISSYELISFDIAMIVLSLGAGSMMISHINDSFFWIVTQKSNLKMNNGIKYFSLMSISQGLGTFALIILIIYLFG